MLLCNNAFGSSNMMEKEIKCISTCEQPCTTATLLDVNSGVILRVLLGVILELTLGVVFEFCATICMPYPYFALIGL